MPLSRVSRSSGSPGRDSLRRHITSGHLAPTVQADVERLYGLDSTSIAARLVDAARRAREVQVEALDSSDHATVLRAIDTEIRTLGILASTGVEQESDVELAQAYKDTAVAVIRIARRDAATAEIIAAELDSMHRPVIADDVRDQAPVSGIEG